MVDCMIRLFDSNATVFDTNGLGGLPDAQSCLVVEERNGGFEVEMRYPVDGLHYEDLEPEDMTRGRIIVVKPNPYDEPQPFRIYKITKPINGIVTVYAAHISYDLSGYPIKPFTATGAGGAMQQLMNPQNLIIPHGFTFGTDVETAAEMVVKVPSSIRSLLGGSENSILDLYGGEYEFNNYQVMLRGDRGYDRGVSIRYGKNLTDVEQEKNCGEVYTGVYPFWYSESDEDGGLVTANQNGGIVNAPGTYDFVKIMPLDLSQNWTEQPTSADLIAAANEYISDNDVGRPKVSITVSFVPLSQTDEYKDYACLETIKLCDTVSVQFPKLGVSAKAKCVKTTYNALTNKYDSIELGNAKSDLSMTIADQGNSVKEMPNRTYMQQAIKNATDLINRGVGGNVILHDSTGIRGTHDELLIMDTDDIATAQRVWRFNMGGLGYSNSGYVGPYGLAMTMDGSIVADFITSGILNVGSSLVLRSRNKEGEYYPFLVDSGGVQMHNSILTLKTSKNEIVLDPKNGIAIGLSGMHSMSNGKPSYDQNGNPVLDNSKRKLWLDLNGNIHMAGNLEAASGTFSGDLSAAGGTFTGDLVAAGGTFSGNISAATGTFTGGLHVATTDEQGHETKAFSATSSGDVSLIGSISLPSGEIGYGSGHDGNSDTDGIVMKHNSTHYIICTTAGVRMQCGNTTIYVTDEVAKMKCGNYELRVKSGGIYKVEGDGVEKPLTSGSTSTAVFG